MKRDLRNLGVYKIMERAEVAVPSLGLPEWLSEHYHMTIWPRELLPVLHLGNWES